MTRAINGRVPISFTKEQLRFLEREFPRLIHQPGTGLDRIMFYNGAQSVLQRVRENTAGINYAEVHNETP